MNFGVVVIGRNEGARLKRSLKSVLNAPALVYVDSGSTDGSSEWARGLGVDVIDLDPRSPFSAARARNEGAAFLLRQNDCQYMQFLDADCEMSPRWLARATAFLEAHPRVAVVFGTLHEREPDASIYNWLCARDWERGDVGEVRGSGGIVMARVEALQAVGGYREDVIAGEDDELCVRLRRAGWKIWKLGDDMATHDAGMATFVQWWRRSERTGYGFAQGSFLHRSYPEKHWVRESRRALVWGAVVPGACGLAGLLLGPAGLLGFAYFPLMVLRLTVKNKGGVRDRASLAFFFTLGRIPEAIGLARFHLDRLRGKAPRIIEYK